MTIFEIDTPKFYRIETNIVVSAKSKEALWQTTYYIDGKIVPEKEFKKNLSQEKSVKTPITRMTTEHCGIVDK